MLSRLVITFLPRSKRLLISWLQSPSAVILEPRKIKPATVSTVSPSICQEQLYGNKMDNLEEMDRFLEKFNLPRLNQEEIKIMNNPITSTEIEAVIKNIPKNKSKDQMSSQENSVKHLEKS